MILDQDMFVGLVFDCGSQCAIVCSHNSTSSSFTFNDAFFLKDGSSSFSISVLVEPLIPDFESPGSATIYQNQTITVGNLLVPSPIRKVYIQDDQFIDQDHLLTARLNSWSDCALGVCELTAFVTFTPPGYATLPTVNVSFAPFLLTTAFVSIELGSAHLPPLMSFTQTIGDTFANFSFNIDDDLLSKREQSFFFTTSCEACQSLPVSFSGVYAVITSKLRNVTIDFPLEGTKNITFVLQTMDGTITASAIIPGSDASTSLISIKPIFKLTLWFGVALGLGVLGCCCGCYIWSVYRCPLHVHNLASAASDVIGDAARKFRQDSVISQVRLKRNSQRNHTTRPLRKPPTVCSDKSSTLRKSWKEESSTSMLMWKISNFNRNSE